MTTGALANALSSNTPTGTTSSTSSKKSLTANDFIQMMITQLQNQDPTEPTKSSDLLAQMSQIGSLQSSTELQSSLKTITLQNSLSSAGAMIGKTVTGKDENGADMKGIVTGVKVVDGSLSLNLDSGQSMAMANVLSITQAAGTGTTGTTAAAA